MGRRGGVAKSEGGAKPAPTEKPKAAWGRWRGGFFAAEFEATLQGFFASGFLPVPAAGWPSGLGELDELVDCCCACEGADSVAPRLPGHWLQFGL